MRAVLRNLDFVSARGLTAHPVNTGPAHVDGTGDRWEESEPPGPCALARENSHACRRPAGHRSHARPAAAPAAGVRSVETPAPAQRMANLRF